MKTKFTGFECLKTLLRKATDPVCNEKYYNMFKDKVFDPFYDATSDSIRETVSVNNYYLTYWVSYDIEYRNKEKSTYDYPGYADIYFTNIEVTNLEIDKDGEPIELSEYEFNKIKQLIQDSL